MTDRARPHHRAFTPSGHEVVRRGNHRRHDAGPPRISVGTARHRLLDDASSAEEHRAFVERLGDPDLATIGAHA